MIIKKKITLKEFIKEIDKFDKNIYSQKGKIALYNYLSEVRFDKPVFSHCGEGGFFAKSITDRYIEFSNVEEFNKKYEVYCKDYDLQGYFCISSGESSFIIDFDRFILNRLELVDLFLIEMEKASYLYNFKYTKTAMVNMFFFTEKKYDLDFVLRNGNILYYLASYFREYSSFNHFKYMMSDFYKNINDIAKKTKDLEKLPFYFFKTEKEGFVTGYYEQYEHLKENNGYFEKFEKNNIKEIPEYYINEKLLTRNTKINNDLIYKKTAQDIKIKINSTIIRRGNDNKKKNNFKRFY